MKLLFLTLLSFNSLKEKNIYTDLLREFMKNGHQVYIISPIERRQNQHTTIIKEESATILRLRIGNTQKTNVIEKGVSTVMIEPLFKWAVKKFFSDVKFDLVLYTTPPITLVSAVEYVKKRDGAKTYLLLKDIFPQNAVDIGMMGTAGLKGYLYRYFRSKEKKLYSTADRIGCMSYANAKYVINHNPEVDLKKVEVCPNSIDVIDLSVDQEERKRIRAKYDIPDNKMVFVYGGNLGKPQGIPFLIECLKKCEIIEDAFFLIVGDGTEYHLINDYVEKAKPANVKLLKRLAKEDFEVMVSACDVGLIFLDHRFTVPNFPSRLLSYMSAKIPVLACTDRNTDVGKVIVDGGFGWWCESNNSQIVYNLIESIVCEKKDSISEKKEAAFEYLKMHYTSERSYQIIMNHIEI